MKQTYYERVGESVYREVLPNGLQICVVPKPEHAKKYAFFATRYGGMDTRFCLDGKWLDTPAGIAHYLEHKMFDTKEGNALQELAKNGAEPNAFTSNAMTGYYFDSTEHFEENLEILLSFVSIPYFTEESVAKEQGIIGQEIRMIEDNPDWQLYTPSTLGANRLCSIIDEAKNCFGLEQAEITVEVNPSGQLEDLLDALAQKGVNRISIGMQSAHAEELDLLGRTHTAKQAEMAVKAAHRAGITNVSMDLMVGIQKQTEQSLKESIAFCHNAGASHISAYLLKIEPNTPYGQQQNTLLLPDDDQMGDFYLCMVEELESRGYHQYEISNFAQKDANGMLQRKYADKHLYLL